MEYQIVKTVDARGSFCPGPMMELVRAIKAVEVGQVVDLISSDKGSELEIPKWCEKAGHKLLEMKKEGDATHYIVQKGERKRRKKN
ncbi:MAG: sulfurtransferase TusA family protein [Methanobacteriota archaeon]|nr:MAG: sulfurtransferase TusA family protein [Euryarchaeota archaeon]